MLAISVAIGLTALLGRQLQGHIKTVEQAIGDDNCRTTVLVPADDVASTFIALVGSRSSDIYRCVGTGIIARSGEAPSAIVHLDIPWKPPALVSDATLLVVLDGGALAYHLVYENESDCWTAKSLEGGNAFGVHLPPISRLPLVGQYLYGDIGIDDVPPAAIGSYQGSASPRSISAEGFGLTQGTCLINNITARVYYYDTNAVLIGKDCVAAALDGSRRTKSVILPPGTTLVQLSLVQCLGGAPLSGEFLGVPNSSLAVYCPGAFYPR